MKDVHCPDLHFLGRKKGELNWDHKDCLRRMTEQETMDEDLRQEAGACADCPKGLDLFFTIYMEDV